MVKERNLIMILMKTFIASFKPKIPRQNFMGEDYNGTKYYEDPNARLKRGRSFVPINKNDFMKDIPAEWEAWLRYRRNDPPTKEEVNANLSMIMMKRKNATELEKIYSAEMKEKYDKVEEPVKISNSKRAFPTYDEYNNFGQNYQPSKKPSNK